MTVYSKDKLIEVIIEQQKTTPIFMEKINATLMALNDNNVLHRQAIEVNTKATEKLASSIQVQTSSIKTQSSYVKWITIVTVVALVILAGAEKALKFFPFFK